MEEDNRKLSELRVIDLKTELEKRHLDKSGNKIALVDRLKKAMSNEALDPETHVFLFPEKKLEKAPGKSLTKNEENETTIENENGGSLAKERVKMEYVEIAVSTSNRNHKAEITDTPMHLSAAARYITDELTPASKDDEAEEVASTEIGVSKDLDNDGKDRAVAPTQHIVQEEGAATAKDPSQEEMKTVEGEERKEQQAKNEDTQKTPNIPSNSSNGDGDKMKTAEQLHKERLMAALSRNLWITNINQTTRATELKQMLSKHGKVIGAKVVINARYPGANCYGFVKMDSITDAERCIKYLDYTTLNGQTIRVEKVNPDHLISLRRTPPGGEGSSLPTLPQTVTKSLGTFEANTTNVEPTVPAESTTCSTPAPVPAAAADSSSEGVDPPTVTTATVAPSTSTTTVTAIADPDSASQTPIKVEKDVEVGKKADVKTDVKANVKAVVKAGPEPTMTIMDISSKDNSAVFVQRPNDTKVNTDDETPAVDATNDSVKQGDGHESVSGNERSAKQTTSKDVSTRKDDDKEKNSKERSTGSDLLTIQKIRDERERETRARERLAREEKRHRDETNRQRIVELQQRREQSRLDREREELRVEREKLEHDKAELLRIERERQKLEREKIELEKMELQEVRLRMQEEEHRASTVAAAAAAAAAAVAQQAAAVQAAQQQSAMKQSGPFTREHSFDERRGGRGGGSSGGSRGDGGNRRASEFDHATPASRFGDNSREKGSGKHKQFSSSSSGPSLAKAPRLQQEHSTRSSGGSGHSISMRTLQTGSILSKFDNTLFDLNSRGDRDRSDRNRDRDMNVTTINKYSSNAEKERYRGRSRSPNCRRYDGSRRGTAVGTGAMSDKSMIRGSDRYSYHGKSYKVSDSSRIYVDSRSANANVGGSSWTSSSSSVHHGGKSWSGNVKDTGGSTWHRSSGQQQSLVPSSNSNDSRWYSSSNSGMSSAMGSSHRSSNSGSVGMLVPQFSGNSNNSGPSCPPPPGINSYSNDRFEFKSGMTMRKY